MKKNYDKKIEDVMHSIDDIGKASPSPFFFTRLEGNMQKREKNIWGEISSFISRPSIAFACVCLVILINMFVIFSSSFSKNKLNQQNNDLTTVDEYSQLSATFYDFENVKP
ncbi:MAG: hypothetical protein M3Z26_07135 [Bacteroidota bacterium]|nr:hypothetical protein [Bacteroidota bacterium]